MPNLVFPSCIIHLFALKFFFFLLLLHSSFSPSIFVGIYPLFYTGHGLGSWSNENHQICVTWFYFGAKLECISKTRKHSKWTTAEGNLFFPHTIWRMSIFSVKSPVIFYYEKKKKLFYQALFSPPRTRTLCRLSSHLAVLPFIIFIDLVSAFK